MPIVTAIGLSEGMSVAEVGSGTGLFLNLLSGEVGSNGRVFATDVSPRVVEFLDERIVAEDLTNVDVVCNDGTSLALVTSQVDRVFVCDAYQSFRNHTKMLASIRKNLRPGGELIIVESKQLPESGTNSANGDSGSQTIQATVEEAGFVYVEDVSIPGLGSGFFLRFRKSAE